MARRSSFTRTLNSMARQAARNQREAEAARKRAQTELERRQRAANREFLATQKELAQAQKLAEKEAKEAYLAARQQEVHDLNSEIVEIVVDLQGILPATLGHDDTISFNNLRQWERFPDFQPPFHLTMPIPTVQKEDFTRDIKPPSTLGKLFGGQATYERAVQEAEQKYQLALQSQHSQEADRHAELTRLRAEHERERQEYQESQAQMNAEVDDFERRYLAADPEAIIAYNSMVLEASDYPDGFPHNFRLAYAPESQELVVEYELPEKDIIPTVSEYKYVKARDAVEEKPRKAGEIKDLYADVVAAVTLRTMHELYEADQAGHIQVLTFNGVVDSVDPATGQSIRPCLVSARTTRDRFLELNLARVEKKACLRNLGAQVSSRPDELQPVKPVVEFNMVDKRFIDSEDVLGGLDSRPNLLDLSPSEFEHLVGNLFTQMGLETRMTRSSRDGGVDVVAYDQRPVLGGKVVIQAKRYRNTVGVSAVRDLYGTMMNEGANKGILVSTSGYGKDAFDFANDKPIELIDGSRLLYLLEQVGTIARIVLPAE